jgi:hypothetical protein
MRDDPLARTLFGSKSAETTHGTIWLHYLHSPPAAFSNGRHRKMRAARTLDMSRRPTTSPSQAAHHPPLPKRQRADLRPASGYMASHLHSAVGESLPCQDS